MIRFRGHQPDFHPPGHWTGAVSAGAGTSVHGTPL